MESRARIVLPIIGILLVVIIALLAFFITRRIRNTVRTLPTPAATASSDNLILPPPSGSTKPGLTATPRATFGTLNRQPVTGIKDEQATVMTTAFDDTGFRTSVIVIAAGTKLNWLNLGSASHQLTIDGLPSGDVAPNALFGYIFDKAGKHTIRFAGSGQTQLVNVQ